MTREQETGDEGQPASLPIMVPILEKGRYFINSASSVHGFQLTDDETRQVRHFTMDDWRDALGWFEREVQSVTRSPAEPIRESEDGFDWIRREVARFGNGAESNELARILPIMTSIGEVKDLLDFGD